MHTRISRMPRLMAWIALWLSLSSVGTAAAAEATKGVWRQRGFDAFIQGRFGNAGQNLYVSRAGVLQRIFQFDFNHDGWVDLVFCNSHKHNETPPLYLYTDLPNQRTPKELPSNGAVTGTVGDLNGDGFDDLVIGMGDNGVRHDLNARVFFGSAEGLSERQCLELPAPQCRSVAVGDFNGDGKPDLAFLLATELRIFYQSELGFEPKRFVSLPVRGLEITADKLQGGVFADLIVRTKSGDLAVYWGGRDGLNLKTVSTIKAETEQVQHAKENQDDNLQYAKDIVESVPLSRVVRLKGVPHLFLPLPDSARLVPVESDRNFGQPIVLKCPQAMAVAVGDVNGDGQEELVLACRQPAGGGKERSWVCWGSADGYDERRRTPLESCRACDVAVGDLDADGCDDIVLCQSHTAESYTTVSLVYRGCREGVVSQPIEIASEDARRVLLIRAPSQKPQVILVNHMSGQKGGNLDASIYLGGPDGYAAERRWKVAGWDAVESLPCDLNDDGWVDLVVANTAENSVDRDPGSYVFLNGPQGLPHEPSLKLPTTRAHGVCCADLNRDGYLDLVFSGFDNSDLLFFYGTPHGFDTAHPKRLRLEYKGAVCTQATWIYLADLNSDGWLDLVVPMILEDRSLILWGGPDGFSMDRCLALSVERAACARAADLTQSGYLDLILGGHIPTVGLPHDSFAYIYWNGLAGLRQDQRTMLPALGINSMAVADFNNDGLLDVFVSSYHAGTTRDCDSYIYWNRKGRGFSATDRTRLFTHSASGCVAGDFNEDGWIDLAIAYHRVWGNHVGYSEVWWNGPRGFDDRHVTRLPTEGPHGMTAMELGNQRDRGPEEYYESSPLKLPNGTAATKVSWVVQTPPKTWVKAQLRWAATKAELGQAAWSGPGGPGSWFTNGQAVDGKPHAGKWLQYRLALGAINALATPRVTEVSVEYER